MKLLRLPFESGGETGLRLCDVLLGGKCSSVRAIFSDLSNEGCGDVRLCVDWGEYALVEDISAVVDGILLSTSHR